MEFRTLRADEIECRVATVSEKGVSLLLYKDARADMNLLDETVGAANWQRSHVVINDNLFCNVSIKVDGEWVTKQDVGTESYTEKEKGQASDSFKRACVNWGIGRELYTAPFVFVKASNVTIKDGNGGRKTTYDRFSVSHIAYDERRNISELVIVNNDRGDVVFTFGNTPKEETKKDEPKPKKAVKPKAANTKVEEADVKIKVIAYLNRHLDAEKIARVCACYGVSDVSELNVQHCNHYIAALTNNGGNIDE